MTSLMVSMMAYVAGVKDRLSSEKGATAVEYGLMVALIAVAIIVTVGLLGGQLNRLFEVVRGQLAGIAP
ncbi:Flp family type IVb pilin [Pseudarthrobacter sp. IC2-21]|uniref:Flp family type IVb pilin n=1 Tax=Pseudarthrobacter sp. IC2-21 TaxID=3092262 RepID=UPI002A6A3584|nr:Flp family type IVb pilin [Pseudarthrobacter sp. IC2-21]